MPYIKFNSILILQHLGDTFHSQLSLLTYNNLHLTLGNFFQHCPSIAWQCSRFCFCPGKKKKNVSQNCTSATVLINLNISINSRPIDFKFCMVPNLTKLNEPKYEKPNQTNPNQTKPNQTICHLNAKYSLISYAIFIKFCMVISITLWHITMQSFS